MLDNTSSSRDGCPLISSGNEDSFRGTLNANVNNADREDREEIYSQRALLHLLQDTEWKRQGIGDAKLLKHKASGLVQFAFCPEGSAEKAASFLVLQHSTHCMLKYNAKSKQAWTWSCFDYRDGEGRERLFSLRFKTPRIAESFKSLFDESKMLLPDGEHMNPDAIPRHGLLTGNHIEVTEAFETANGVSVAAGKVGTVKELSGDDVCICFSEHPDLFLVQECNVNNVRKVGVCLHDHPLVNVGLADQGWVCEGFHWFSECLSGITDFDHSAGIECFTCRKCMFTVCSRCYSNRKAGQEGLRLKKEESLDSGQSLAHLPLLPRHAPALDGISMASFESPREGTDLILESEANEEVETSVHIEHAVRLIALEDNVASLHEKFASFEDRLSSRLTALDECVTAIHERMLHLEEGERGSSQEQAGQLDEASKKLSELRQNRQSWAEQGINGLRQVEDFKTFCAQAVDESQKTLQEQVGKMHDQMEGLENHVKYIESKFSRPESPAEPGVVNKLPTDPSSTASRGQLKTCSQAASRQEERRLKWPGETAAGVSMSEAAMEPELTATAEYSGIGQELDDLVAPLTEFVSAFQTDIDSFGHGPGLRMQLANLNARLTQLEAHLLLVPDEVQEAWTITNDSELLGAKRAVKAFASVPADELSVSHGEGFVRESTIVFGREATAVLDKIFNNTPSLGIAQGDPDPRETHIDAMERIFSEVPTPKPVSDTICQL